MCFISSDFHRRKPRPKTVLVECEGCHLNADLFQCLCPFSHSLVASPGLLELCGHGQVTASFLWPLVSPCVKKRE